MLVQLSHIELKAFKPISRQFSTEVHNSPHEILLAITQLTMHVLMIVQIVTAAEEVIDSINKDELARYFSLKSDPDDEGAEVGLQASRILFIVHLSPFNFTVGVRSLVQLY